MAAKTIYFVTGTDTGVGKTVVTALLTRFLRERGDDVMAIKPFCSGGREDAYQIHRALGGNVTLDAVNPWHFRAPLTPLLAARKEGVKLAMDSTLRFVRGSAANCETLLIEGAGGLLSPLGEGFDARDLILKLRAIPLIVTQNRLGAINQTRMALDSLPSHIAARARVVLVDPKRNTVESRTNVELLHELVGADRIFTFPHVQWPEALSRRLSAVVRRAAKTALGQNR